MKPDSDEAILYATPEECCEASLDDMNCPVFDGCELSPTPSPFTDEIETPKPSMTTESVTPLPTPMPSTNEIMSLKPTACEERLWYFSSGSCTNGYSDLSDDNGDTMYLTLNECCEYELPGLSCLYNDVCKPPTPAPFEVVTYSPTFGSTPTVSKETTGPPTMSRIPRTV